MQWLSCSGYSQSVLSAFLPALGHTLITHLYTYLGGTQIPASLQPVLGGDSGISHSHASMNVGHLILDVRQQQVWNELR